MCGKMCDGVCDGVLCVESLVGEYISVVLKDCIVQFVQLGIFKNSSVVWVGGQINQL